MHTITSLNGVNESIWTGNNTAMFHSIKRPPYYAIVRKSPVLRGGALALSRYRLCIFIRLARPLTSVLSLGR